MFPFSLFPSRCISQLCQGGQRPCWARHQKSMWNGYLAMKHINSRRSAAGSARTKVTRCHIFFVFFFFLLLLLFQVKYCRPKHQKALYLATFHETWQNLGCITWQCWSVWGHPQLPRIQDPQRWGGGIELAILAAHYATDIPGDVVRLLICYDVFLFQCIKGETYFGCI